MGRRKDFQLMVNELKSEDWSTRLLAAANLGISENQDAVEPLLEVLHNDENPRVRSAAASALGRLGHTGAKEHLKKAAGNGDFTGDNDTDVRTSAINAIKALELEGYTVAVKSFRKRNKAQNTQPPKKVRS